mmetsp:Transcript_34707/g.99910  ORF Transcript_34707/g.99910 Transcript_34707/m.99910 type:complete len:108 (+) Transcript_34707:2292-2615(+)
MEKDRVTPGVVEGRSIRRTRRETERERERQAGRYIHIHHTRKHGAVLKWPTVSIGLSRLLQQHFTTTKLQRVGKTSWQLYATVHCTAAGRPARQQMEKESDRQTGER